jgi:transcriptional regulator with XRE-family HTH domain
MAQTTVTDIPTIGDVIRAWRKFRELSSGELAEKAGVRSQYLSEIEHNRTANPREKYLVKLADALKVPLQDIYGRRMPPEKREDGKPEEEEAKDAGEKERGGVQPAVGQSTQNTASLSPVLNSPLSISHQKILMRKLEVLERTIREIRALVGPTQDQE